MTTTVTLPRSLMLAAKVAAVRRGSSFKALVVDGIRLALARQKEGR